MFMTNQLVKPPVVDKFTNQLRKTNQNTERSEVWPRNLHENFVWTRRNAHERQKCEARLCDYLSNSNPSRDNNDDIPIPKQHIEEDPSLCSKSRLLEPGHAEQDRIKHGKSRTGSCFRRKRHSWRCNRWRCGVTLNLIQCQSWLVTDKDAHLWYQHVW